MKSINCRQDSYVGSLLKNKAEVKGLQLNPRILFENKYTKKDGSKINTWSYDGNLG